MAFELDLAYCKVCQHKKMRIQVGKYDDRNKRFLDETGKAWNGRVCPQCHRDRQAALKRIQRAKPATESTEAVMTPSEFVPKE
jgi:hypothetical protein